MLLVVSNDADDLHDTGRGHPERRSRTRAALDGLVEADLADAVVRAEPRAVRRDELLRVHHARYLDALEEACAAGGGALDPDTTFAPGSWATAERSAGAGLDAIERLDAGDAEVAFVLTRPPGHHALPERGMGFCLFNNVAVAAAALADRGERVLVLDWDVHHGNGTQAAFWDDPRVLFVSTHQRGLFPSRPITGFVDEVGGSGAIGATLNVPLPPGARGGLVRDALERMVLPEVEAFAPTWVLVSAGFDAHRADPLADLDLSSGDFADLGAFSAGLAPGPGRLVLFLEGGYDLDALRLSAGAAAAGVLGRRYRPEGATAGGPGDGLVSMLIDRRARVLDERREAAASDLD